MWNNLHQHTKSVVQPELKILQDHLLTNCLCNLPLNVSPTVPLRLVSATLRQSAVLLQPSQVFASWTSEHVLSLLACLHLMCDKTLKQTANPYRCQKLTELRTELVQRQNDIVGYLLTLADNPSPFIRFEASRTFALYMLLMKSRLNRASLGRLVNIVAARSELLFPQQTLFALDTLKRIIEWRDLEEHVLEDCFPEDEIPPDSCNKLVTHAEPPDSGDLKCSCIELLVPKWARIMTRFTAVIRDDQMSITHRLCVLSFLGLWEAIISVKANLSIIDTKSFYCCLDSFTSLLTSNVSPSVWKSILSLFNEVLCYGSTLALQHDMPNEPCSLAHMVVRLVKDRRLLRLVPPICGSSGFGGSSDDSTGDKVLLKRTVLMILKAVAVTIKEAKDDSSSDASTCSSEHEDADHEMDMICRSIHDVLKKLDVFVKENEDFHPSTRLASWIVRLFIDQDDYLVESMVCCLDVAHVLCYRNNFVMEMREDLNPSETFLTFLNATSFNVDLLVDFLKSKETCFLLYILNFLKYLRDQWGEFIETCKYELPAVGKLLRDLRLTIEREVADYGITYNISPVVSLLIDCEQRICTPEQLVR